MKICSKTQQITQFKKISRGNMPPNPPANAWLRHELQSGVQLTESPKSWAPLANPAYAHGLLLRNLFGEMRS